jgi:drug/metabolite transporter (DMT)-like permease
MTDQKKAYWMLHTAVFLFGFTGILGQLITLEASLLVWYRMGITAILMFTYIRMIGVFKWVTWKELKKIASVALLITFHWLTFYGSIKYGSVSVAMICLSSLALCTALLEPLINKTKLRKEELLFSVIALAGIVVMFRSLSNQWLGITLGLISAVFSALFTIYNKALIVHYDARLLSFYEILCGFLMLTILLPIISVVLPFDHFVATSEDWLWLLVLSFFCTVLAFNLSLSSLRHLSPFTVNLAINLEPVYGIALAFVVFNEHKMLNYGFYLGSLLIMLSVLADMVLKRRKAKTVITQGYE